MKQEGFEKLVKRLKLPKTLIVTYTPTLLHAEWEKRGGRRGEKSIAMALKHVHILGFVKKSSSSFINSAGTYLRNSHLFVKDDLELRLGTHYGNIESDNRYWIELNAPRTT